MVNDEKSVPQPEYELIAGHVALDFVNTLENRPDPARQHENLTSLAEVLRWAQLSGIITAADVADEPKPQNNGRHERRLLTEAIALREVICRIFTALARGRWPVESDVMLFNRFLRVAMTNLRLEQRGRSLRWQTHAPSAAAQVLDTITRAAADLLTSPKVEFVRECASGSCRWLFLDTSKNHQRRWCDMKTCGNRAKVRRFHATRRKQ
jgi:predicted RNA-binding Zn ribbon-like protein